MKCALESHGQICWWPLAHLTFPCAHTGATGFLGSVVLERLLSKVPTMSRITVIVRSKKGRTGGADAANLCPHDPVSHYFTDSLVRAASDRMEHLLGRSELFRMWRNSKPNADCLDVRSGDTTLPLCGLSTHACAELARSVTHVIHCAASIAFDEAMHESLRQNYEVRHARTRMRSGSIATL